MSVLSIVACVLNRHHPVRREVSWDGRQYTGRCRHCDAPIRRLGRRTWRRQKTADTDR